MFSGTAENCRRRGKKISPFFPEKRRFAELASGVYDIRADAVARRCSRGESDEEITLYRQGLSPSEAVVAAGLDKIISGAMQWHCGDTDKNMTEIREELFALSAEWRRMAAGDFDRFAALRNAAPASAALQGGRCYGDLPEADIAAGMGEAARWDTQELILRYRLEAWQSLLLKAGKITLEVTAANAQQLRRLLRRMRFHRLLCRASGSGVDGGGTSLRMEISGPADILLESRKYGMNLACFFPAVTLMPQWKLESRIKYREHDCILSVDREEAAVGDIARRSGTGAYEPEEFAMFRENFAGQTDNSWLLCDDIMLFRDSDGTLIIPDFVFTDGGGRRIALELFHLWHSAKLLPRLQWLQRNLHEKIIVGIDRRILPRGTNAGEFLAAYPGLENRVFLYRDYPGASTVAKMLNKLLQFDAS